MYGVGVLVLLLGTFTIAGVFADTLGQRTQPFFDPDCFAATDCSWSWSAPTPGTQFCEMILYDQILNVCPNPIGYTNDPNKRPPPPDHVEINDINRYFNQSASQDGPVGQYTCLNITYRIDEFSATKVKGIQLSILGNDFPDLNRKYCLNLNFSDGGLDYSAVQNFRLSNRCFCGLKPGIPYTVTIRSLPVDDSPANPADNKYEERLTFSVCSDPSKAKDVRCQKSEEALWSPVCIDQYQNTSIGEYDIVELMFNVAPASYNFDKYRVNIYKHPIEGRSVESVYIYTNTAVDRDCKHLSAVATVSYRFNTTAGHWNNAPGTMFIARIWPYPTRTSQCLDSQGDVTDCLKSDSEPFDLILDPCKGNPCGQAEVLALGKCIPKEDNYSCDCEPGYMEWGKTCEVDPCINRKDWVRHCTNGECLYNYSPDPIDYYCNCSDNFVYLRTEKRCVADPCSVSLETSLTTCGPHGLCVKNVTDDQVTHKCICDPGYTLEDNECQETVSIGMIIGVVLASCVVGLLLFLAICLFRRRRHRKTKNKQPFDIPVKPGDDVGPEPVLCKRRVLPIYSDDHPQHKDVIQCFCRFLRMHCQCEVSLMEWNTSVGPTVEMWLTAKIEQADLVLLLCSKGTGIKYRDKSRFKTPAGCNGVYGDVFVKALTLLDEYFGQNNANEKFVVAYFDYSSEGDIPVPFRRFAKYNLMQCMEDLYLRIHSKVKDSPHSRRRVTCLQESNYPNLNMGRPLHEAIKVMRELIKAQPNWYKMCNNMSPQISYDSAYDSGHQAARDFFKDTPSTSRSSNGSGFEESFQHFDSIPVNNNANQALPEDYEVMQIPTYYDNNVPQPETRFFSDDLHFTMNRGPDERLQSSAVFSDIQIEDIGPHQGRANSFV